MCDIILLNGGMELFGMFYALVMVNPAQYNV